MKKQPRNQITFGERFITAMTITLLLVGYQQLISSQTVLLVTEFQSQLNLKHNLKFGS